MFRFIGSLALHGTFIVRSARNVSDERGATHCQRAPFDARRRQFSECEGTVSITEDTHQRVRRDDVLVSEGRRTTQTQSAQIPAINDDIMEGERQHDDAPTQGRTPQRTARRGIAALHGRLDPTGSQTFRRWLDIFEGTSTPTRFTVQSLSFIVSEGWISPECPGAIPLALNADDPGYRDTAIQRLWALLHELVQNGDDVDLEARAVSAADIDIVPDEHWVAPIELFFYHAARTRERHGVLRDALAERLGLSHALSLLVQRDRAEPPLSRALNVYGGERLSLQEGEALIEFAEVKARHVAALSSAAIPGAHLWFGVHDSTGMMVLSIRDLTLVSTFPLGRLGHMTTLAPSLSRILLEAE